MVSLLGQGYLSKFLILFLVDCEMDNIQWQHIFAGLVGDISLTKLLQCVVLIV